MPGTRGGAQLPQVLPERPVQPAPAQRMEEAWIVVDADRGNAPPGELVAVGPKQLEDLLAQGPPLPGELGVEGLGVVGPDHEDHAKWIQVDHEVEGPLDVVQLLTRRAQDERMAVA